MEINLGIVIDRSGSVENEKYPLEENLKLLIESFKKKYLKNVVLNLTIAIIGEEDILLPLTTESIIVNNLKMKKLKISEGIKRVLNSMKSEKKRLVLYSDGYFENGKILLELELLDKKNLEIVCIGIGEGYNKEMLRTISSEEKVYEYRDVFNLI